MKLLGYELRKLCGMRFLWILLALLTVLCAALFYYESGAAEYDYETEDFRAAVLADYAADPDRFEAARAALEEYDARMNERYAEFYATHDPDREDDLPEKLKAYTADIVYVDTLGYDGYGDDIAIAVVDMAKNEQRWFIDRIDNVISVADGVLRRYTAIGAGDSPVCEYERHFIDVYGRVRENVRLPLARARGWDKVFSYDRVTVFVLVYLILGSGVLFLHERTSGTLPIVRTTRRGRSATAAAKIISTLLLAAVAAVVFSLGVLITSALTFGLSDPSAPIQLLTTHRTCPYVVSIWQYALMTLGVRVLAAVMFAAVVALASSLSFSPVVTYITGTVITVANVIVNFFITSSDWLLVNLVSVMTANGLLSAYTEVILFGRYHSTVKTTLVIYASIAVAAAAAAALLGGRRSAAPSSSGRLAKSWQRFRAKLSARKARRPSQRRYPCSMFVWECEKLLTPAMVIVVAALLILSAHDSEEYYGEHISRGQLAYEEYINEHLFGPLTDEKIDYINERVEYTNEYTSEERLLLVMKGPYEELIDFLDKRDEAMAESSILESVKDDLDRLSAIREEDGVDGWFMFDVNVGRILSRDINIYMLAAIVIVFSRMYAPDYAGKVSEGNFASILRTTRRGRRASYRAKLSSAAAVSLLIGLLFIITDAAIGISSAGRFFDIMSAPLISIRSYADMNTNITVGAYFAIICALRAASCVMIALITSAASFALHKLPATLFAVSMFTLLPYALVYMGVKALRFVDITAMVSGGKLMTRSSAMAIGGSPFAFAAIFVCGYAAVTAAASLAVRAKTGK